MTAHFSTKNRYCFFDRLSQAKSNQLCPVIAEIKAYTPKNGDLIRDRPIASIAELYERYGMACMSVVTGHWFKGKPQYLRQLKEVSGLPLLRKDFIVTKSALEHSKELGASAVLLTKQLVDHRTLKLLADHALKLGMTPFVEVSLEEETAEMRVDAETILAVCNKDIKTQETDDGDISKSLDLLDLAKATGAGLVVSASAIENSQQARQLIDSGFDGLLIGTAFLQAADLAEKLGEFRDALKGC